MPEGAAHRDPSLRRLGPDEDVYRATGTVPGFILNNYALSEYEGELRVATTEEPPWLDSTQQAAAQSR